MALVLRSHAAQNIEQTHGPLAGPHIMFLSALKSRYMGNMTQEENTVKRERLLSKNILNQFKCV